MEMSYRDRVDAAADGGARPRVSLLMPVYNTERYLRESLESALSQDLLDIELVCMDDGSTDGSARILAEAASRDPRVRVLSKGNSGYGDSMNRALEAARGEYVGILEPDDVMLPGALSALVGAGACGRAVRPVDDPWVFFAKPSIWSAVYRRDFLDAHRIRFLPTPGAAFQDTSFTFKVFACAERAVFIHDPVIRYRQDNASSSVNASDKVFCVCDEYAEIERWIGTEFASLRGDAAASRLGRIEQVAKYDSYMWSYVRLAPRFRAPFLERMAREYGEAVSEGRFELDDLREWKRVNLAGIMADPAGWARDNASYAEAGPIGRAWHYLRHGGPGVLVAYLRNRSSRG